MDTGQHERAPGDLRVVGGELAGARRAVARAPAHLVAHLLHGLGGQRAAGTPPAAIVSPRPESTHTAPPVAAASARTTSSSPCSSSTSRSSRLWIAIPRWSTSYCSFTSLVNARSVSAMNGSS